MRLNKYLMLILVLQTQIGQHHASSDYQQCNLPCFAQSIKFFIDKPCVKQIHYRIMNHIKRKTYLTQHL